MSQDDKSLTTRQSVYRNYLKGVTWQGIRKEALEHYDCTCQRCQGPGRDVHHIEYPEHFGEENLNDLIVLCRKCHDLEHKTPIFNHKKQEPIHVRAITSFLSTEQTLELQKDYPNKDLHELFLSETQEGARARHKALHLLEIYDYYGLQDFKKSEPLSIKQLQNTHKNTERDRIKNFNKKADKWKKVLAENNPRLHRKLS